jgi:hypothetical protein
MSHEHGNGHSGHDQHGGHGGHDEHGGHGQLAHLAVVVNGEPTLVAIDEKAPLGAIIPVALEQTHNIGQPPENWELHDAHGNPLDINRKIKDFHFPEDVRLRLSLKAGIGG